MKLIEVDPKDIPTERLGRRGRVSYPLIKSFLESNIRVAKIDMTGYERNPTYLRSVLHSYIRTHSLPIKMFAANGELHLMRLDMDAEGNVIEDWQSEEEETTRPETAPPAPITPIEVERRSGKQTKS